jgi:hypothetical protein
MKKSKKAFFLMPSTVVEKRKTQLVFVLIMPFIGILSVFIRDLMAQEQTSLRIYAASLAIIYILIGLGWILKHLTVKYRWKKHVENNTDSL